MFATTVFSWLAGHSPEETQYVPIPSGLPTLFDDRGSVETLAVLDLSNQNLSDSEFKAVVKEFHEIKHGIIQSINLSGNHITGASVALLDQLLFDLPDVKQLDLSHNNLRGEKAIKGVAQIVEHHPKLNALRISDNNLGPDGVMVLAELFASTPKLRMIDLGWKCVHRPPEGY